MGESSEKVSISNGAKQGPPWLGRGAASLGVVVLAVTATYITLDFAARRYVDARPLADDRVVLSLSLALGVCVGAVAWRSFRSVRSVAWLALLSAAVIVSSCGFLYSMFRFHLEYGSISSRCGADEFAVDECLARDWSFMQGRHGFRRAGGRIDRTTCRAFERDVLPEPRSPMTSNGWVRCPIARPDVWRRWPCDDIGHSGMNECFVCFGRSDTNDNYVYSLAFDRGCTRGVATYGVNVDPRDLDACSAAPTEDECPYGWIGRFSEHDVPRP